MTVDTQSVLSIPDHQGFAECAALPATFGTAYIAIRVLAQMQRTESILIHAAAGGTGQAAIQIAQGLDATIFATVGSAEKRQWLVDTYGISKDHIFYSRDSSFADGVKRISPKGVDVVINSVVGDALQASWGCIAPFGRFIEIGKRDILSNANYPWLPSSNMSHFMR